MKSKSSRGFFFVLISFMLIMYIFLYLAAWMNAMEISEKTSSEKFRVANLEGIVAQLSEDRFSEFFDISGYYALHSINDHASDIAHPLKYNESDELFYLRKAFFEATLAGESDSFDGAALSYSPSEMETYTFDAWLENLNQTLWPAGLQVKSFEIYDTNFTQLDRVRFLASMNLSIFVQDSLNTISVNRTFRLERTFNITGFEDPMIKREYYRISHNTTVERQIFFTDKEPSDLAPVGVINGSMGQGFFYGPMIAASEVSSSNPVESKRGEYILVGNFSEIQAAYAWQQFGAYIATNEPESDSHDGCSPSEAGTFNAMVYYRPEPGDPCALRIDSQIQKPFAVIEDFDISAFRGPNSEHHALIVSEYAVDEVTTSDPDTTQLKYFEVSAYDVEELRDAAVCAYFLPSERGPSYAQRLSRDAPELRSEEFGMETLLVGKWAGGEDLVDYDNISRVDFEFFQKAEGVKVRGMPGCKTYPMCITPAGYSAPLGHFAMSHDSLDAYGTDIIACNDGRARCDP